MAWYRRLVVLSLLGAGIAAAQEGAPSAQAHLDAVYALSGRSSSQGGTVPVTFGGVALSHLRLSGDYFPPLRPGSPLGAAADLAVDTFTISGNDLAGSPQTKRLTGLWLSGAAVARWSPMARLSTEGHLGYAYTLLPAVDTSTGRLEAASVRHHGPLLEAAASYEPRLSLPWPVAGQLRLRMMPLAFGGNDTPAAPKSAFQLSLSAQAVVGSFPVARFRMAGVIGYELAFASASASNFSLGQTFHRFGIGVRVSLPEPGQAGPPTGPGVIRGRVVSADGNQAVPGATIEVVGGPSVLARPDGTFELESIPPGPVALRVRREGFKPAEQTVTLTPGGELELALTLARPSGPGRIRGSVVFLGAGGAKVPLPEVQVGAEGRFATTGLDGKFVIEGVGPGPVPIKVAARGFKTAEEVVAVPPEGEATIDLVLQKAATRAPALLKGQVRSLSGKPVAATLRIPEAQITTRAGSDGRFLVRLPGGRYTVRFEAPGFVAQSKVVEVADGDQAIFYVDLSPEER